MGTDLLKTLNEAFLNTKFPNKIVPKNGIVVSNIPEIREINNVVDELIRLSHKEQQCQ